MTALLGLASNKPSKSLSVDGLAASGTGTVTCNTGTEVVSVAAGVGSSKKLDVDDWVSRRGAGLVFVLVVVVESMPKRSLFSASFFTFK